MDKARAELEAYRQRKRIEDEEQAVLKKQSTPAKVKPVKPSRPWIAYAYQVLDMLDPLDCFPLRAWRSSYDRWPLVTLGLTIALYILGQIFFIWCEFGAVFFVFSCLTGICLGLGSKREGEVSAYSVFNSRCERLLGSMTSEHFERDMLHRNK